MANKPYNNDYIVFLGKTKADKEYLTLLPRNKQHPTLTVFLNSKQLQQARGMEKCWTVPIGNGYIKGAKGSYQKKTPSATSVSKPAAKSSEVPW